ncbi:hypothetical protein GWN26_08410 [Candidatus Saccharibacteria bacterium]|nr:hypothetical protein [Candidatus Saccharibacteria bacterium]
MIQLSSEFMCKKWGCNMQNGKLKKADYILTAKVNGKKLTETGEQYFSSGSSESIEEKLRGMFLGDYPQAKDIKIELSFAVRESTVLPVEG